MYPNIWLDVRLTACCLIGPICRAVDKYIQSSNRSRCLAQQLIDIHQATSRCFALIDLTGCLDGFFVSAFLQPNRLLAQLLHLT